MRIVSPEALLALTASLFALVYHAVFVAAEFAFLRRRFSQAVRGEWEVLEEHRFLAHMFDHPERTTRMLRLGAVLCAFTFLVSVSLFVGVLRGPDSTWRPVTYTFAVLAIGMVYYVVAELVPRSLALRHPERALLRSAVFIRPMFWVLGPLNRLIDPFLQGLLRLLGFKHAGEISLLDIEEELEARAENASDLSPVAEGILRNALALRDLEVGDVLLPRNQVNFWDLELSVEENLAMARETGHTRFPLCEGDLDRCIGLIHIKDIFRYPGDLRALDPRRIGREILRIDHNESLERALSLLQVHNMHMALVIDEFRGVEGVLTLERVLEELVGDIRDEFDAEEPELIKPAPIAGEMVVSGLIPLHEIEDSFGVDFDNGDVSTLSGLITSELGRIPETGEAIRVHGLEVEVTKVDETRVIEARVRAIDPDDQEPDEPETEAPAAPAIPQLPNSAPDIRSADGDIEADTPRDR